MTEPKKIESPVPSGIVLHNASRVLELQYTHAVSYRIPFELLRVYSPSAEVRGHGEGQETPQTGKREVSIASIEPVGSYALQPTFSDGHSTGIYTWDYLFDLATNQDKYWAEYFEQLARAGLERDTPMPTKAGGSCGGSCSH